MRTWIYFLCLLPISHASLCPVYQCGYRPSTNLCLTKNLTTIEINGAGCNSDSQCLAIAALEWAKSANSTDFPCEKKPQENAVDQFELYTPTPCPTQQPNKGFLNGQVLVLCAASVDCILKDGSFVPCECSLRSDGNGVCHPDISNPQIFSGYWEECRPSGKIENKETVAFWQTYQKLFSTLQSNLPCVGIFLEVQEVRGRWTSYSWATGLALLTQLLVF